MLYVCRPLNNVLKFLVTWCCYTCMKRYEKMVHDNSDITVVCVCVCVCVTTLHVFINYFNNKNLIWVVSILELKIVTTF